MLKFVLASQEFVFSLCLCNKVPYDINGVLLLLSAHYFFLDMCLSPHVVHKGI